MRLIKWPTIPIGRERRFKIFSVRVRIPGGLPIMNLTEREILAIEMAAGGYVSSPLGEWPILSSAFNKFGLNLDPRTGNIVIKKIAKSILNKIK